MTDLELLHIITMPTRYQILMLLLNHHYCGKALSAKLGISESAVSQHLQVLKTADWSPACESITRCITR